MQSVPVDIVTPLKTLFYFSADRSNFIELLKLVMIGARDPPVSPHTLYFPKESYKKVTCTIYI